MDPSTSGPRVRRGGVILSIVKKKKIARTFPLGNGRLSSNVYIKKHIDVLINLLI